MKKTAVTLLFSMWSVVAIAIIPEVIPYSIDDIPVVRNGADDNPNYILRGDFLNNGGDVPNPARPEPGPAEEEGGILDVIEINTDNPLDMNWDAQMHVSGTSLLPVFELKNDFLPRLPFRTLQNLEIKYKWLKWMF